MKAVPPKIDSLPTVGWLAWIALIFGGVALGVTIYLFNPAMHHFYPVCQLHRLTGLNCPGCGMTRAVYALLHGQLLAALRDNALFVLLAMLCAFRLGLLVFARSRGRIPGSIIPSKWVWVLLVVTLLFGVLRNLPAFSFLSP